MFTSLLGYSSLGAQVQMSGHSPVSLLRFGTSTDTITSTESKKQRAIRAINNKIPDNRFLNLLLSHIHFYLRTGKIAHRRHPQTINDYLFALKTSPDMAKYSHIVDKEQAKGFIEEKIGSRYVIPTLAVFKKENVSDLKEFDPEQPYILKPTHMSGSVIIKQSGGKPSKSDIEKCQDWLKKDFFKQGREYNYKGLESKVIAEPLLRDNDNLPADYKFHVIHGRCELVEVLSDRFGDTFTADFYDKRWQKLKIRQGLPNSKGEIPAPKDLSEMVKIAEKLGSNFEFARIDLYQTDEGPKVGEITLTPGSCAKPFDPPNIAYELYQKVLAGRIN